jgi:hypothetical protein
MTSEPTLRIGEGKQSLRSKAKDFLFGLFYLELHRDSLEFSRKYRDCVDLLLFAELLGIPFMTSPVTLKLLPYFIKDLAKFKEDNLKERDLLVEIADHDLH